MDLSRGLGDVYKRQARAKVQYAELVAAKGRHDEARNLMRELIADDQHSPRFQRVRDKAWIRRAKKLL
jgi:hypothetical protein